MCLWLQAFVDTCTKDILGIYDAANVNQDMIGNVSGHCFTRAGVSFISLQQQSHIEGTGIGKGCESQSVGSYHHTATERKTVAIGLQ